ncbi:aminotransferase class I/II-fold pyridoxal phosphate-dependent enzyme [Mangrovivirga sp. M17]|uniref:Aminotransferase n=1 Tax=Mangrovivirga halotolerans TaxID=2993936 RepID=A0ABT3RRY4_9BACT|nr:aminotransferase class I/II-fold pyridoxal phosphate-dependent enzyme [Mangrovivirga halotolerans]MCX2744246.1 aminotransferase class I/II-fold pyridoxal phosphate-dependent enzyme [Mangrovivirga halotolerans]
MSIKIARRLSGSKEYYFSTKLKQLSEMKENGIDILNLGIGSPDMAPPENAVLSLIREAGKSETHGYQSYRGLPEFRTAVQEFYQIHYHSQISDNNVLPLIGSKEGLMHIAMTYLEKGDIALVPDPGYPTYEAVTRMAEATPVKYKLNEKNKWLIDTGYLENLIKSFPVKVIFMNYPHMPTGASGTINMFKRVLKIAEENNILLINDNPYSFILNDSPISALQAYGIHPNLIELNSLSKSHNMAGWRIGFMVTSEEHISNILKFKTNMDSGMFLPVQIAAAKALKSSKTWFDNLNKEYKKRKLVAMKLLDQLECKYDTKASGMFIWARIPDTFSNGEALSDHILNATGVFLTPGFIFGEQGDKFIRISLCSSVNTFEDALNRILSIPNKIAI